MRRGLLTSLAFAGVLTLPVGVHAEQVRSSPYAQDAVFFEAAARSVAPAPRPELNRVFGGVVTHHTPNAAALIVDFYARLAAAGPVDTFVIMGPDHFERGSAPVTVSRSRFMTPFGTALPDERLIDQLVLAGHAVPDEAAFDDHTIHSQLLAITRVFPDAKIVPLLFRSKGSNADAYALGTFIARIAGPRTVVVASVDFSHYLTALQARPLDTHAAKTLALLRPDLAGVAEADSPQALTALIAAVRSLGATTSQTLGVHNSDEFSSRRADVTTGYVVQYFGTMRTPRTFIGALDRLRYAVGYP